MSLILVIVSSPCPGSAGQPLVDLVTIAQSLLFVKCKYVTFVQMSKSRTIGIVRSWPRHSVERQTRAVTAAGATVVYVIPDECPTWREVLRFVRSGDCVLVELIQLLPEPKSAKVRHPAMDGRDAIEEIERRGGYLIETATKRSTADPKQRAALISDMARSVGAGGRSLSSEQARANGEKAGNKRGKPPTIFSPEQIEAARKIWESRRVATWDEAAKLLPKGFTVHRAFNLFGPRAGDGSRKSKRN
jgi:hypothetical protein